MFIQFGKSNINHGHKARDQAAAKADRRARAPVQGAAGVSDIAVRGLVSLRRGFAGGTKLAQYRSVADELTQ
jgi:hypothetical protein